eukprot:166038_1
MSISPVDVSADDGLLGLIYFCVAFTILVFIWALSYFISNTKDTLEKNKAGPFKDVIKGSSKLNFISYGSAIYGTDWHSFRLYLVIRYHGIRCGFTQSGVCDESRRNKGKCRGKSSGSTESIGYSISMQSKGRWMKKWKRMRM